MKAFFVIGPEGSGTYMLAEAFVAAGCTYCDGEYIPEWLEDNQDSLPENLVLRRSLPHAGKWPYFLPIIGALELCDYEVTLIFILRDQAATELSVARRRPSDRYVPGANFGIALKTIGELFQEYNGRVISYEYFINSKDYRRIIFEKFGLDNPKEMEFYDGNKQYY